jgi:hypothetical protein
MKTKKKRRYKKRKGERYQLRDVRERMKRIFAILRRKGLHRFYVSISDALDPEIFYLRKFFLAEDSIQAMEKIPKKYKTKGFSVEAKRDDYEE